MNDETYGHHSRTPQFSGSYSSYLSPVDMSAVITLNIRRPASTIHSRRPASTACASSEGRETPSVAASPSSNRSPDASGPLCSFAGAVGELEPHGPVSHRCMMRNIQWENIPGSPLAARTPCALSHFGRRARNRAIVSDTAFERLVAEGERTSSTALASQQQQRVS